MAEPSDVGAALALALAELQQKSDRLVLALKAGHMGTWDLDLATMRLAASSTCKENYGRADDDSFTYEELAASVLEEDHAMWRENVEASIATGGDLDIAYRTRWPDASVHWVHVRASVATEDGRPTALSGVSSRIDAQKAVEAALREADRRKDEFLTTASHELRTPLNAILGWTTMLQTGRLDEAATRKAIATIERNARTQVRLIEDILDGSRMLSGKLRLEVQPLDLTELVAAAADLLRPIAEAKGLTLDVADGASAAHVVGDRERLQQVTTNLLSNAIKFTPPGGRVTLQLERVGTHVELSVRDTGHGIAPEFLPHVFERFRQADGSTTRRHGGLGLGLALVEHLVVAHGGSVTATSAGPGSGATFTVRLPVPPSVAPPGTVSRPPPTPVLESLEGVTALVVDDEPDARELVASILRLSGAEVETASGVDEALALLATRRVSIVLSDIGMPGRDGYAFVKALRAMGDIPAIALTAYAREEDERLALDAGFRRYLAKPVDAPLLVRTVADLALPPAPGKRGTRAPVHLM